MNSRRLELLVPAGMAPNATAVAGRCIVWAIVRTAAFTAWFAFGGPGGGACGFGLALVAGRCCGGADVVDATDRDVVAVVICEVEPVDWLVGVLVGVTGVAERAAGAGSGPSLGAAFTGGASGPAPSAAPGATTSAESPSRVTSRARAIRSR